MTDYEELEKEIIQIVGICEKLPEIYKMKVFDILISKTISPPKPVEIESKKEGEVPKKKIDFQIPIDVRAMFSQYSVPETCIQKLFLIDQDQIRPIYKITTTKKSEAQIQIATLTALENSLKDTNTKFEFAIEDVRRRCNEMKCYDSPNFNTNFKNKKNLFKSLDDPEHVALSPDGKAELAETVNVILNGQGETT